MLCSHACTMYTLIHSLVFLLKSLSRDKSQLQASVASLEKEKRDIFRSKDILQNKVNIHSLAHSLPLSLPHSLSFLFIQFQSHIHEFNHSLTILFKKVDTFDIKKVNALQTQLETTQSQLEETQKVCIIVNHLVMVLLTCVHRS